MIADLDLLALLFARFCHDLSGPISAIRSGHEFLVDEMADHEGRVISQDKSVSSIYDEAMKLIDQSSHAAVARLQFFRHAYGATPEIGEANLLQLRQLATQYFQHTNIKLQWPDSFINAPEMHLSRISGKVLLNMLIIIARMLMQRGVLAISMAKEKVPPYHALITVSGQGEGLRIEDDIHAILLRSYEHIRFSPTNAQAYYTMRLVDSIRSSIEFVREDQVVSLCYVCREDVAG